MKYIKRPCRECPWRTEAQPGRFEAERWEALAKSSTQRWGPSIEDPMFACHVTTEGQEQVCAGWLAVEGHAHPRIRLEVMFGHIPACALTPAADWPPLFGTFAEAARHDMED